MVTITHELYPQANSWSGWFRIGAWFPGPAAIWQRHKARQPRSRHTGDERNRSQQLQGAWGCTDIHKYTIVSIRYEQIQ